MIFSVLFYKNTDPLNLRGEKYGNDEKTDCFAFPQDEK